MVVVGGLELGLLNPVVLVWAGSLDELDEALLVEAAAVVSGSVAFRGWVVAGWVAVVDVDVPIGPADCVVVPEASTALAASADLFSEPLVIGRAASMRVPPSVRVSLVWTSSSGGSARVMSTLV